MKRLHLLLVLSAVLARTGFAASFDINLIPVQFKADNYLRAAISLQAMGREVACQALLASAKTNAQLDERYFVLCRMLFTQRGTNQFRPPFRGTVRYVIGQAGDWPLDPIELVDGIPFFLTAGSAGSGNRGPEFVESYLHYCMTNCDWNTYTFREATAKEKSDALAKLLSSDKVRRPLTDFFKKILQAQIE